MLTPHSKHAKHSTAHTHKHNPTVPTCKLREPRRRALLHVHAALDELCCLDPHPPRRRQRHLNHSIARLPCAAVHSLLLLPRRRRGRCAMLLLLLLLFLFIIV